MKLFDFRSQPNQGKRGWRKDRKIILDFNKSLSLITDIDSLMASIATRIEELFDVDQLILLRPLTEEGLFTVAFSAGYSADELSCIRLAYRDKLPKWLLTNEMPLVVGKDKNIFNYLSQSERETLTQLNVRICAPLLALNRLTGIMMLSSKKKGWQLGQEDIGLLQMLMSQFSIAFANALLYEQQRDRLRRLNRAERLAAAGQLAAAIAHEIRNPLTTIRSTVQYLTQDFSENSPKRALMEAVISEVDRIDRTVDGLLGLARRTEFEPERIGLGEVIDQMLLLARKHGQKQSVEIIWAKPSPDVFILGDAGQIKQLFLNIALNALQAMENGGRLEIGLELRREPVMLGKEKLSAEIVFKDTGCGIPAESLDKVLEPFFTTKKGGTGLGLSTSYAITRQHGGELEIDSHQGIGTTIAIRFPVVS